MSRAVSLVARSSGIGFGGNWKTRGGLDPPRQEEEVKEVWLGGDRAKVRKIRISFKTARVKEATIFHGTCEHIRIRFLSKIARANEKVRERSKGAMMIDA